jgi:ankyrin repeat protein
VQHNLNLTTTEIVQEAILYKPEGWNSHPSSQHEVENLVRLFSFFYQRVVSMDIGAELISATSILYRAIALDSVLVFESLVEKGLVPQSLDFFGRTALHIAVNANATIVAQYQLDIDAKDGFGQRALLTACKYRRWNMVQILVEKGADVNVVDSNNADEGRSALLWAAAAGDKTTIQLLLGAGADIHYRAYNDRSGNCALEEAIEGGHTAVLQLLLENDADTKGNNSEGWTALHLALENEDEFAVQKLMEKGADISVLTSMPIYIDGSRMLLQKAVAAGRLSMVKLFTHYGIHLDTKGHDDYEGQTALHCAAVAGDVRMVDPLLGAGAGINIRAFSDERGSTALRFAIEYDHDAVIQLLLENGADVDLGHPLTSAIRRGQKSTVQRLIEKEVDLEASLEEDYILCYRGYSCSLSS